MSIIRNILGLNNSANAFAAENQQNVEVRVLEKILFMCCLMHTTLVATGLSQSQGDKLYTAVVNGRNYTMFVPGGVNPLRGLITNAPGAKSSTLKSVTSSEFEHENARLYGYALMGWDNGSSDVGSDVSIAISKISEEHNLPSLNERTPRVVFGFSAGGGYSWKETQEHPERVIFYAVNKGRSSHSAGPLVGSSLVVPGINIHGSVEPEEFMVAQEALFKDNRAQGAYLALAIDEGAKHITGSVYEHLAFPYLWLLEQSRNPKGSLPLVAVTETGWLADPATMGNGSMLKIYAVADYPVGLDKKKAAWLLNKNAAYSFAAYSTQNKKVKLSGKNKSVVDLGGAVTYTATIDPALLPKVQRIEFYDYANKIGENAPGNYTFTFKCSAPGLHNLIAIAVVSDASNPSYISNSEALLVKQ